LGMRGADLVYEEDEERNVDSTTANVRKRTESVGSKNGKGDHEELQGRVLRGCGLRSSLCQQLNYKPICARGSVLRFVYLASFCRLGFLRFCTVGYFARSGTFWQNVDP